MWKEFTNIKNKLLGIIQSDPLDKVEAKLDIFPKEFVDAVYLNTE